MSVQNLIDPNLLSQIKKLSISERILIVEDIWDSIAFSNEQLPITDEQKSDLDQRLADYKENPDDGDSWSEVKKRIESKL
ncbi:MAG: addiction module protein [Calditrichaceae bacterium]|nr:addiction module protein [Calditrichaceae bacterium]